jgi:hypothetical protein
VTRDDEPLTRGKGPPSNCWTGSATQENERRERSKAWGCNVSYAPPSLNNLVLFGLASCSFTCFPWMEQVTRTVIPPATLEAGHAAEPQVRSDADCGNKVVLPRITRMQPTSLSTLTVADEALCPGTRSKLPRTDRWGTTRPGTASRMTSAAGSKQNPRHARLTIWICDSPACNPPLLIKRWGCEGRSKSCRQLRGHCRQPQLTGMAVKRRSLFSLRACYFSSAPSIACTPALIPIEGVPAASAEAPITGWVISHG